MYYMGSPTFLFLASFHLLNMSFEFKSISLLARGTNELERGVLFRATTKTGEDFCVRVGDPNDHAVRMTQRVQKTLRHSSWRHWDDVTVSSSMCKDLPAATQDMISPLIVNGFNTIKHKQALLMPLFEVHPDFANLLHCIENPHSKLEEIHFRALRFVIGDVLTQRALLEQTHAEFSHNDLQPDNVLITQPPSDAKEVFLEYPHNGTTLVRTADNFVQTYIVDYAVSRCRDDPIKFSEEHMRDMAPYGITDKEHSSYDHHSFLVAIYNRLKTRFVNTRPGDFPVQFNELILFIERHVSLPYRTSVNSVGYMQRQPLHSKTLRSWDILHSSPPLMPLSMYGERLRGDAFLLNGRLNALVVNAWLSGMTHGKFIESMISLQHSPDLPSPRIFQCCSFQDARHLPLSKDVSPLNVVLSDPYLCSQTGPSDAFPLYKL